MFDEGNTKSNRNVYSFRLRSKVDGKDVAPFFEVSTPDEEGKWNKLDKQIKNITGKLIQVKTKEGVYGINLTSKSRILLASSFK